MGVRKTTDFLEKATWWLAGTIMFLSVISTSFLASEEQGTAVKVVAPTKVEQPAVTAPLNLGGEAQAEAPAEEAPAQQ